MPVLTDVGAHNLAKHNGVTPLYIASHNGHLEVVRFLCAAGADPEDLAQNGMTPLSVAQSKGHTTVLRQLQWAADTRRRACCLGSFAL